MGVILDDQFTGSGNITGRAAGIGGTPTQYGAFSGGTCSISSNGHASTGSSATAGFYYSSATPSSADYSVEMKVSMNAAQVASGELVGPMGRCVSVTASFYIAGFFIDQPYLMRYSAGSVADYIGTVAYPVNDGDVIWLKLKMTGSTIEMFIRTDAGSYPGTAQISATNTGLSAAGVPGLYFSSAADLNRVIATDSTVVATRPGAASVVNAGPVMTFGGRTG